MRVDLESVFGRREGILIGMVHVGALPGTPANSAAPEDLAAQAVSEATILAEAGFDAVMLENMHDTPYMLRDVGPEIVASMSIVARAVREAVEMPMGIQILAGANMAALAVAHAAGAQFIRAEGFCFATVADEGMMDTADAGPLLRYRKQIGAEHIAVLADIRKKHSSHALTGDLTIADWAHGAEFMGADGLVVTGRSTGKPADLGEASQAREACDLPVFVGSGVNADSLQATLRTTTGVIIGSSIKIDGCWKNPACPDRARACVEARNA